VLQIEVSLFFFFLLFCDLLIENSSMYFRDGIKKVIMSQFPDTLLDVESWIDWDLRESMIGISNRYFLNRLQVLTGVKVETTQEIFFSSSSYLSLSLFFSVISQCD